MHAMAGAFGSCCVPSLTFTALSPFAPWMVSCRIPSKLDCRKDLQAQRYKGHASTKLQHSTTSVVSAMKSTRKIGHRIPSNLACRKDLQAQWYKTHVSTGQHWFKAWCRHRDWCAQQWQCLLKTITPSCWLTLQAGHGLVWCDAVCCSTSLHG